MSKQTCQNCKFFDTEESEHHQPGTTWCTNPVVQKGADCTKAEISWAWINYCNGNLYEPKTAETMTKEKFIEWISIDEEGHYPFYAFVEEQSGETTLAALALSDVRLVYFQVQKFLMEGAKKIYFTLDFPPVGDIQTDFVAAYFKEGDAPWESVIIPYNKKGNRLELITGGETFDRLLNQCKTNCHVLFKIIKNQKYVQN